MDYDTFISKAANRQIRRSTLADPTPNKDGFVTIHTRIHQNIHALLKAQAQENQISLSAMLEFILLEKYRPMLIAQEVEKEREIKRLIGELDTPDEQ